MTDPCRIPTLANRLYFARPEYPARFTQEKEDEVRILSQLRQ